MEMRPGVAQDVMSEQTGATGSRSLPARLVGVLLAPRATYADVAARPRVVGALVLVLAVLVTATFVFLSTEVGQQATLDNQVRQLESFGRAVSDAQYQQMERMAPFSRYVAAGFQLVVTPLMALLVAAVAFAVFNALLGGEATFKQVYAVVVHSGVLLSVQALFTFVARLLGSIDLFLVWWIVSLAIGLSVLYRRRTAPVATTMLVVYVAIGLVIAAIKTATSGA